MHKEARLLGCLLLAVSVVWLGACARKPAYSEMEPNKPAAANNQSTNQNSNGQAAAAAPSPTEAAQAAQPSTPPETPKRPSFMDPAKGSIKDLPVYPNAHRVSVQIGPIQGVNMMSLGLKSSDPMDKIAAFYERVIKENKWTVTDKIIDPEFSEWNLKKGEEQSAKVQVKKDQQTGAMDIVMVRAEKIEGPSK